MESFNEEEVKISVPNKGGLVPLKLDVILFNIFAAVISTVIFFAMYIPFYIMSKPGATIEHFSFVLIMCLLSHIFGMSISVILVMSLLRQNTRRNFRAYWNIFSIDYVMTQLWIILMNAMIYMLGFIKFVSKSVELENLFYWLLLWFIIKLFIRMLAVTFAKFLRTRILLLVLFFISCLFIFVVAVAIVIG